MNRPIFSLGRGAFSIAAAALVSLTLGATNQAQAGAALSCNAPTTVIAPLTGTGNVGFSNVSPSGDGNCYSYEFDSVTATTIYIPFLDPNAATDTSDLRVFGGTATFLTSIPANWPTDFTDGKSAFNTPGAILDVTVGNIEVEVAFLSPDASVAGPIVIGGTTIDPPVPGAPAPTAVPEPASLALLGAGLIATRLLRRRKRA